MAESKVIAVLGATGAQGGGLVRAILADKSGGFAARAITRESRTPTKRRPWPRSVPKSSRPTSMTARACGAFEGAYGALLRHFLLGRTFLAGERGGAGPAMAQAAKRTGLRHVIWSTLEDTRKVGAAQRRSDADADGQVQGAALRRARAKPTSIFTDLGVPTTFLLTSFYWDNLIYFGLGPKKGAGRRAGAHDADGRQEACRASRSRTSANRAYGIFKKGRAVIGKTVGIAGEHLTGAQMAAAAHEGARTGRCATTACRRMCIRGFGFPGADDLGNMFQF